MTSTTRVCVVAPCHNEEGTLPHFVQRIRSLRGELPQFDIEILLVDDGSTDNTSRIIAHLAAEDALIRGMVLSRNFGHQRAISAGLDYADADFVVVMDADLQDPPELIPRMLAQLEAGFDVVHAVRTDRRVDSAPKRITARLFYAFMRHWVLPELVEDAADFKAFNRQALEALRQYHERVRFLRGLVAAMGFRQTTVPFVRAARHSGKSKYNLRNVLRLARDAIVSNSSLPLRLGLYAGLMVWCVSAVYGGTCMAVHCCGGGLSSPGLHALAFLILGFFGLNFVLIGLIGEYLKTLVLETKHRPLYLVRDVYNLPVRH